MRTFVLLLLLTIEGTAPADAQTRLYGFKGPGVAPWSANVGAALTMTPTPLPEGAGGFMRPATLSHVFTWQRVS